jgi:hypothetical protein
VIVLCFVNENAEKIIQDKLNGLARPPFAVIVVSSHYIFHNY